MPQEQGGRDQAWASIALKMGVGMALLILVMTLLAYRLSHHLDGTNPWVLAVIALGLLASSLCFTFILDRIVTKPVIRLSEFAVEMAKGDFSKPAPSAGRDEVGDLSRAMEKLRRSFLVQKLELEALNKDLDQKVIARTEELRTAQDQLIKAERLASVGRLAGGVAHEINNPTGVILTRAGYLLALVEEKKVGREFQDDLEAVQRNAQRISKITSSLLSFSRQSPVKMEALKPLDVINAACELVTHGLRDTDIKLAVNCSGDLPWIKGDTTQLEQVLVNLMTNGIDAMEPGGTLSISAEEVQEYLKISVRDTGPGIPPEIQEKIFEPFFTTKEVGKGTGLGLSITYGIVADHQGTIHLESNIGEGTVFTIRLPLLMEDAGA